MEGCYFSSVWNSPSILADQAPFIKHIDSPSLGVWIENMDKWKKWTGLPILKGKSFKEFLEESISMGTGESG